MITEKKTNRQTFFIYLNEKTIMEKNIDGDMRCHKIFFGRRQRLVVNGKIIF